ncbi:hypothetical protein [Staphylococcus saprophyticus]|nr:hypothetical protein [Staphylococcus saprophyticus]
MKIGLYEGFLNGSDGWVDCIDGSWKCELKNLICVGFGFRVKRNE